MRKEREGKWIVRKEIEGEKNVRKEKVRRIRAEGNRR